MNTEAIRILNKYPDRIPIILKKNEDSNISSIEKTKNKIFSSERYDNESICFYYQKKLEYKVS